MESVGTWKRREIILAKSIFRYGSSDEKLTCTTMIYSEERKWDAFSEAAWAIRSLGRWANVFCKIIINNDTDNNKILKLYNMS